MNETFRLGRIGGVRVGVNWTVAVVFTLIAYGLAAGPYPQSYKGRSGFAYAAAGLVTAVLFFGSLLAHELAHAFAARRNGLEVAGITLWLLGGVSRLEGEAPTPRADMQIAGSGPLVSIVLGLGFGALSWSGLWHGLPDGCLVWLAGINLVLAAFNLIPAAPLDGGRLLRAVWWRLSGDKSVAALRAAQIGQWFGRLLVVGGLAMTLRTYSGLWLVLAGWFLAGSAGMEGRQARLRSRLSDVTARQIMTPDPFTVAASTTAAEFLGGLRHRHSVYPLDGGGDVVPMTEIRAASPSAPLGSLAVSDVLRIGPDEPVSELVARFTRPCALVFDGDALIGIVTSHDLRRAVERYRTPGGPPPGW